MSAILSLTLQRYSPRSFQVFCAWLWICVYCFCCPQPLQAQPHLKILESDAGRIRLHLQGELQSNYRILASPDLAFDPAQSEELPLSLPAEQAQGLLEHDQLEIRTDDLGEAQFEVAIPAGEALVFFAASTWLHTVQIPSTLDGSLQPSQIYLPSASEEAVPLIVNLHSWRSNYLNRKANRELILERWAIDQGWAFLRPNFRGPNDNPDATGSDLAVQDVVDAVNYAKSHANIDASQIYVIGSSGGGHMALLLAGRHPTLWAGVSAWVPISDLALWYEQRLAKRGASDKFVTRLVASTGGAPGDSSAVDAEYSQRSPRTHLSQAANQVPIHISAGINDGHSGDVPINHSLYAFNELAAAGDQLSEAQINSMTRDRIIPSPLDSEVEADPSYGTKAPLFRRSSQQATLTIFDGRHEMIVDAAIAWIESLRAAETP